MSRICDCGCHAGSVVQAARVQIASMSCCLEPLPPMFHTYHQPLLVYFRNTSIMCGVAIFNRIILYGNIPLLISYRAHSHYALLILAQAV